MPEAESPKVRIPREGEPIPSVDPEDLRRSWKERPTWTCGISPEAQIKFWAVSQRDGMIRVLDHWNHGQLLAPWKQGEELDDAVFRIAATFPMRVVGHRVYKLGGEDIQGYDPNAFVQQLIEETGISQTWEPMVSRINEGGCLFHFTRVYVNRETRKDGPLYRDEEEARRCTREVFWDAWDRYFHLQPSERENTEMFARSVASWFGDFIIDNFDLAQRLMADFRGATHAQAFAIITELERRAKNFMRPNPPTTPPSQET